MGDCLQGHSWRPGREMSCLCFPFSHQTAHLLPLTPSTHRHPTQPKDKWQQEKSTSVLTATAFSLSNKLQPEGWSRGSGGRHAVLP